MEKVTNPPAFPQFEMSDDGTGYCRLEGMSLRDWFAGLALSNPTVCSIPVDTDSDLWPRIAADQAYRFADAMLAQREQSQ